MSNPDEAGSTPIIELFEDAVAWISPDASLEEVADTLSEADVGVLVVGNHRSVAGVISERDVVRAVSRRLPLASTRAIEVANASVVWCDSTAVVSEVAKEMMESYIRHVLVEKDGHLVGIVSARDLLGIYATDSDALDVGD